MPQYVPAGGGNSTFLSEFGDLLPDIVRIAASATRNAYGESTPGVAVSYRARVMHKSSARRDVNGEEFTSPLHVILDCQSLIPLDAVLTLPDGTTHIVRDSELFRDENNLPHHATVYLAD